MDAPSAACVKEMGIWHMTFAPSRVKIGCLRTETVTSRSPFGPPFEPALPSSRTRKDWPSSIPAGTLTLMVLVWRTLPLPRQAVQGSVMMVPVPPHCGHGCEDCMVMPMKFCCVRTVPVPWQYVQVCGVVPSFAPVPWQVLQVSMREKVISRSQPKAASSKLISISLTTFWPLLGPLLRPEDDEAPPPKKSPKISPRSPKPPKPPPNPPPKPAPAFGLKFGSTPAKPYWSYRAFLSASERIS